MAMPPILDVGCGTGLAGVALRAAAPGAVIDGADISAEMLKAAKAKAVYRDLFEADLTQPAPEAMVGAYGGVVSSGVFTHGHLGPDALDGVVAFGRPGALFALGVNAAVYVEMDFAAKFRALAAAGEIADFRIATGRVYAPEATHEHRDDRFEAAIFRRA